MACTAIDSVDSSLFHVGPGFSPDKRVECSFEKSKAAYILPSRHRTKFEVQQIKAPNPRFSTSLQAGCAMPCWCDASIAKEQNAVALEL
jgi:hypothetical protein